MNIVGTLVDGRFTFVDFPLTLQLLFAHLIQFAFRVGLTFKLTLTNLELGFLKSGVSIALCRVQQVKVAGETTRRQKDRIGNSKTDKEANSVANAGSFLYA